MIGALPFTAGLALLAVVALILLARAAVLRLPRRLLPFALAPARGGPLMLEQALALDARRRLLLVRCGERRALLLTGGAQDMLLGWLEPPA